MRTTQAIHLLTLCLLCAANQAWSEAGYKAPAQEPSASQTAANSQQEKKKPLNIACFNYPPFVFTDPETREISGFLVELEKRIWEPHGYEVNFQLMPLMRTVHQITHDKADLMCGYVPNVSSDVQLMPLPIGTLVYKAWVPKSDSGWQYDGLNSLKSRKLLTIHSLYYSGSVPGFRAFIDQHPPKLELSGQHPTAQAIRILRSGRADTLIMDEPHMNFYLDKLNMKHTVKTAGIVGIPTYIYIAAGTHNPKFDELQTIFLMELLKLRESGELAELRERFGVPDWGDGGHLNSLQRQPSTGVLAPAPPTH